MNSDRASGFSRFAPDEVGVALHLARGTAMGRHGQSTQLADTLQAALDLWEEGRVAKTRAICEATVFLGPEQTAGANWVNTPCGARASVISSCRLRPSGPGVWATHGRPLTTASTCGIPRSASSAGSSRASARATSTFGCRRASSSAQPGLSSTARCRPRPPVRSWIARVNDPVPGPSSTITGSPVAGSGSVIAAASAAELGATAAVCRGSRANSRRNRPVSAHRDMIPTVVAVRRG